MKNRLTFLLQFITLILFAQTNTFPTSGNVGIGTTSPGTRLHVKSDGYTPAFLALDKNSSSEEGGIQFRKDNSVLFYFYSDNMTGDDLKIQSAGASGEGDGTPRIHLPYSLKDIYLAMSGGNVGIGTSTPATKLDVFGTIRSNGNLISTGLNNGNGILADDGFGATIFSITRQPNNETRFQSYGYHTFYSGGSAGSERMRIDPDGNVGIGTSTPVTNSTLTLGRIVGNPNIKGANINGGHVIIDGYDVTGSVYLNHFNSGNVIVATGGGNVGIGTESPGFRLDVEGTGMRFKNSATSLNAYTTFRVQGPGYANGLEIDFFGNNNITSDLNWSYGGGAGSAAIMNVNPKPLVLGTNNQGRLLIDGSGNVGIGTASPDAKLAVNGTVHAKEVKVDLNITGPDYVFEKDYNLMSLEEIKAYIEKHKHLPEVPSAKEMETNGVNLSEMNMILLKKVEELTLHVIEQNKKLNEQQDQMLIQASKISSLESKISKKE